MWTEVKTQRLRSECIGEMHTQRRSADGQVKNLPHRRIAQDRPPAIAFCGSGTCCDAPQLATHVGAWLHAGYGCSLGVHAACNHNQRIAKIFRACFIG